MKLRKGVKGCNGATFNADDVVYTFARAKSVSGAAPIGWFLSNVGSIAGFTPDVFGKDPKAKELGDEVKKISGDDSWWNVRAKGGVTGFISAASVTDRKVILSSTGKVSGVGVDTADVVMAGKGFNKQIEESYARNGNLNYKAVNKLEAIRIGESDQLRFSQEGQLIGGK